MQEKHPRPCAVDCRIGDRCDGKKEVVPAEVLTLQSKNCDMIFDGASYFCPLFRHQLIVGGILKQVKIW